MGLRLRQAVVLGVLLFAKCAAATDERACLRHDLSVVAAACGRQDLGAVLAWLSPRVTRAQKDRTAVLEEMRTYQEYAARLGMNRVVMKPDEPQRIERRGALRVGIVPFLVTLEGPTGTVVARSYALAESADGRRWRFVPLYKMTNEDLNRLYPEFAGRLKVLESAILKFQVAPDIARILGL